MPFKPFLRLLGQDVLLERTRDLAHQRVARGLYAEKHLPQKLHLPAAVIELGRKYPQVFSKLFSRFERNYAIISHVGSSLVVFGKWHYTTSSKWNRLFAYFTSRNSSRPIKSGMRLILGVKKWGYSSRSSAISSFQNIAMQGVISIILSTCYNIQILNCTPRKPCHSHHNRSTTLQDWAERSVNI